MGNNKYVLFFRKYFCIGEPSLLCINVLDLQDWTRLPDQRWQANQK